MPRSTLPTRVLPKLAPKQAKADVPRSSIKAPRLYNAKRLVQTSQSSIWRNPELQTRISQKLIHNIHDDSWRPHVSPDVAQFIDDMEDQGTKLLPEEQMALLKNPVKFFSRPQNVPLNLRTQVYFPDFSITLKRSRYLSNQFAMFGVPLWFSKLDLKGYLKEVYNVDVVDVRSMVAYPTLKRYESSPRTQGMFMPRIGKKRMIVQLVEPFEWPTKFTEIDRKAFDTRVFREQMKLSEEAVVLEQNPFGRELDKKERKSIAEQAQELLAGKTTWSPTWQHLPQSRRMLLGNKTSESQAPVR